MPMRLAQHPAHSHEAVDGAFAAFIVDGHTCRCERIGIFSFGSWLRRKLGDALPTPLTHHRALGLAGKTRCEGYL